MGFETANVFTARLTLVETDYPDRESVLQFYDRLRQGLEALPGVASVGFVNSLPGTGPRNCGLHTPLPRRKPLRHRLRIPGFGACWGTHVPPGGPGRA